jgi:single-stranded-DNA-specific exonuclease
VIRGVFVIQGGYLRRVEKSCNITEPDANLVAGLQRDLGIHTVTARCLVARGLVDTSLAKAFLEPKLSELRAPIGLAGLAEALPRLVQAALSGETVGVFGDYDADGVTTATLLTEALEGFGVAVVTKVASRSAGYGFGVADAESFIEQGCTLIITGDCGTSDIEAIEAAGKASCPVIIIDHHTVPSADSPHPAFALINPFRADSSFPFQGMASVGLSFYVMGALRTALRTAGHFEGTRSEPNVCSWLDLVAIGTVADMVPLNHENRIMTKEGLRHIAARTRPGVAALLDLAGVKRADKIDERTIGWKLGPRINAPGRLGDAKAALDVLRAPDHYTAQAAAQVIEIINTERRSTQEKVFEEALEHLGEVGEEPAIVVAGEGWAHGVVGIIASRLVDLYQRPVLVIAVDAATGEGRGSARSFGGVNLYDALAECSDLLGRFGGHAAAAGLTMQSDGIDELRTRFQDAVVSQAVGGDKNYLCDAELCASEVNESLAAELATLAPFGKGNEEPLLMSRNLEVSSSRRVGDGSHLKLTLKDVQGRELSAIAFGMGERDPGSGARIDVAYVPAMSTWAGRKRLELSIKEIWAS